MKLFNKSTYDHLIVGLGNIGPTYEGTRHNVGFVCVEKIAQSADAAPFKSTRRKAETTECRIGGERCLIAKPTTYMNLSGEAVRELTDYYGIPIEKVIVISDDIELDPGRLRIRKSGGHGGQNGLRNIIDVCGSDCFARVRIGTGKKPCPEYDLAAWVLSRYTGEDGELIKKGISRAADAVVSIITDGIEKAMSEYNRQVER